MVAVSPYNGAKCLFFSCVFFFGGGGGVGRRFATEKAIAIQNGTYSRFSVSISSHYVLIC